MRRRLLAGCADVFIVLGSFQLVSAAISATATITGEQQLPSGKYEYTVSLTNNGSTSVSTFWFGWIAYLNSIPYDLMPSQPSSVVSPAGWFGSAQHDGIGQYGIEWYTNTALAPGQTANGFVFDTADSPAVINGTSFFAGYPVRESWVYQNVYAGTSNSGAGAELTPTIAPAPEPGIALVFPILLLLTGRRH